MNVVTGITSVFYRNSSTIALVTTGEGKFFSGLDLQFRDAISQQDWLEFISNVDGLLKRLATFPIPTIAAINGRVQSLSNVVAGHVNNQITTLVLQQLLL